jgi:hypothetical protein
LQELLVISSRVAWRLIVASLIACRSWQKQVFVRLLPSHRICCQRNGIVAADGVGHDGFSRTRPFSLI